MKHLLRQQEDLRWFLAHTGGFRGGYITDIQMSKKRLLDERSGRDVLVGTTVGIIIRYCARDMHRVARLTMHGVTDFSILEQEGEDCSVLSSIQAEASDDRLRFWFDPEGRLFVVCEEALFEEIATPAEDRDVVRPIARWTFQAEDGTLPTIDWLLHHLDDAGMPCIWRAGRPQRRRHPAIRWEGDLTPSTSLPGKEPASVRVLAHGSAEGSGFALTLLAPKTSDPSCGRVLALVADLIARTYPGTCVAGDAFLSCDEWLRSSDRVRSRQVR